MSSTLAELERRRAAARLGGGEKRIAAQHAKGKLTARERLVKYVKSQWTIVEFADYQCPFCHRAQTAVDEVLKKYAGKVKLVYRDFPLDNMHPQARNAAEAAYCAGEQGKFWEYHRELLKGGGFTDEDFKKTATTIALDAAKWGTCVADDRYRGNMEKGLKDGQALGVTGTPAFFINGRFINGARPFENFRDIIDEELASIGG